MNIACIGAHPDDVDLAMGGTVIRLLSRGHSVLIYDLSNGEPTPFGSIECRKRESETAARIMGVSRKTLELENRYILDTIEARKMLAGEFRSFQPDVLFTHYPYDAHPDHTSSCSLVEASKFYSKLTKSDISGDPFFTKKVFYYFPNHIHLNLTPDFCVDVSNEMSKKVEALNAYESQFIKKGNGAMIEEIRTINAYFGIRIGKKYAEPFFSRESLDVDLIKELF